MFACSATNLTCTTWLSITASTNVGVLSSRLLKVPGNWANSNLHLSASQLLAFTTSLLYSVHLHRHNQHSCWFDNFTCFQLKSEILRVFHSLSLVTFLSFVSPRPTTFAVFIFKFLIVGTFYFRSFSSSKSALNDNHFCTYTQIHGQYRCTICLRSSFSVSTGRQPIWLHIFWISFVSVLWLKVGVFFCSL